MEAMRQVSSDIAHDLRTPLTRLRNRLEAARAQAVSVDAYAEAVDGAIQETDAVLATFRALLRIAQMEAGAGRSGFTQVDLSDLLGRLIEVYAPVAEERGDPLIAEISAGCRVQGDPDLLLQMLSNVIENALHHTPAGTRIELRVGQRGAQAVITVADNGPGIPSEARDKVFQRFYRLDFSRSAPGSGLGLSLVAAVATLHGIEVKLDDNNPGLRVTITFPPVSPDPSHSELSQRRSAPCVAQFSARRDTQHRDASFRGPTADYSPLPPAAPHARVGATSWDLELRLRTAAPDLPRSRYRGSAFVHD